ncbi:MAG TPA: hypothetical protein VK589_02425 [Chryseolinea sp.]|nr:hypothetical protein [Chryseolinea sp.]
MKPKTCNWRDIMSKWSPSPIAIGASATEGRASEGRLSKNDAYTKHTYARPPAEGKQAMV